MLRLNAMPDAAASFRFKIDMIGERMVLVGWWREKNVCRSFLLKTPSRQNLEFLFLDHSFFSFQQFKNFTHTRTIQKRPSAFHT